MTRPVRTILIVFSIAFVLAAGFLLFIRFAPDSWIYSREIAQGNRDAQKIDAYRRGTGRLPASLEDVVETESESGPIYYQRCSETHYILSFGTTLGEGISWDSDDRRWVSRIVVCPEGG